MVSKLLNSLRRKFATMASLHPSSYPFVSGDTFRALATHVLDQDSSFDPDRIRANDSIFVAAPYLDTFFTTIHPRITEHYLLITHNGDTNITENYLPYLTDTIIHWFAQNCQITHPKITPLPIGLENKRLYLHGIPRYFASLRKRNVTKQFKVLYKFTTATNPQERGRALTVLEKHPLAETYSDWRESKAYLSTLQDYAFIASPRGNGEDCIRTWEAMYLGTIPIVQRSAATESFVALGLPIVIIDDWKELAHFDEEKLRDIYGRMSPKRNHPALWADFWQTLIISKL